MGVCAGNVTELKFHVVWGGGDGAGVGVFLKTDIKESDQINQT